MTIKYIKTDKSSVFRKSTGKSRHRLLIYGDAVDATNTKQNGRTKVKYGVVPNKDGWVKSTALSSEGLLEIYFIDVGQGDSTFIVTPNRKKILVDGGENDRALRFLSWKYKLENVSPSKPVVIDLLVVSHADSDHLVGLTPIIASKKIKVKKIIHGGLAPFIKGSFDEILGESVKEHRKKYIVTSHNNIEELDGLPLADRFRNWKKAIQEEENVEYSVVDSQTGVLDFDDPSIKIEVLAPRVTPLSNNTVGYEWFGNHSETINGHSVILRLTYKKVKLLLSGDLNTDGANHLLEDSKLGKKMDAHILKAPHHGSHQFSYDWLDAVNPQISVISSGDQRDHGHPRANFLAAAGQSSRGKEGSLLFSTEIAATFVEGGQKVQKIVKLSQERMKKLSRKDAKILKGLFIRKLHGMINVRTDGEQLFAARRFGGKDQWEMYSDIIPSSRTF